MITAVIFDLDGVVVDSEPIWFETYSRVLRNYGFTYTKDLDQKLARGHRDAVRNIVDYFGISKEYDSFAEKVRETYKKLFFEKVDLMPGVRQLLERFKEQYKFALASSAYRYRVDYNLEKFPQLKRYFEVTVAGDEVRESKPAPDIFLSAKKLGEKPENCLVIEDSAAGIEVAKTAGMKCIGLVDPDPKKQDISTADKQVQNLKEITPEVISSF